MTRGSWLVGGLSPDALASFAALLVALDRLAEKGHLTPCQHPARAHWWTSDHRAEREAATHACGRCPLLTTCAATTRHETAHVWAGTDRTPTTRTTERTNS